MSYTKNKKSVLVCVFLHELLCHNIEVTTCLTLIAKLEPQTFLINEPLTRAKWYQEFFFIF